MIGNLKNWLAKYCDTEIENIETYFKNENVTGFLIIWTFFEQKLFGGFLRYDDLESFSEKLIDKWSKKLKKEFHYFFERYQDEGKFSNLIHKQAAKEIKVIRKKDIKDISEKEMLFFLSFVVYRYRNNIFHGNKGVDSWTKYKAEIEKCVSIMTCLLEE